VEILKITENRGVLHGLDGIKFHSRIPKQRKSILNVLSFEGLKKML
jgi:hypothetical protein